ncbi:MAG: ribonuclease III [Acidobacteriota bacterium]|nr:ribonuclease III [Acidobacteriota bacterium]MDH3786854.1 ribonuclease III [Acidobacteriota bacterium]
MGKPTIAALEVALGYRFKDRQLLGRALTHRSHSHEQNAPLDHYERMEFLGDALLGFVVADELLKRDAEADEGTLSRRRQQIVRAETLAEVSGLLGLGVVAHLGRGEDQSGGREKVSLLADLFESVLAAIYLDGGIRPARAFVRRHLRGQLRASSEGEDAPSDAKTRLQERVQGRLQVTPRYRIVSKSGLAHALQFTAEVLIGQVVYGCGEGGSRKAAEQSAAKQALQKLAGEFDA